MLDKVKRWRPTRSVAIRVALGVLVVISTGYAFVAASMAGDPEANHRLRWLVSGIVAVLVPPLILLIEDVRRTRQVHSLDEQVTEAQTQLIFFAGKCVRPCAQILGEITAARRAPRRRELLGKMQQAVVNAAAELCGPDKTRAVAFEVKDDGSMSYAAYYGGSEPSSRVFRDEPGDEEGQGAFEHVRGGRMRRYEDLEKEAPRGFKRSPTTNYQTFITGPITAGDQWFGMLNVDAPQAGDLGERDFEVVSLLAAMLGAAHAAAIGRRRPEPRD